MTGIAEPARKRSLVARIGVTALNLLSPGLGLIRVGRWRDGLRVAVGYQLPLLLAGILALLLPAANFTITVLVIFAISLITIAVWIFGLVCTWRATRAEFSRKWWSRWYALILWYAIALIAAFGNVTLFNRSYRTFYVASISMAPTFAKNEKTWSDMRWRTPQIGNILLVRDHDGVARIYRVAALGGQTFAMRQGVPVVDGHAATQTEVGRITLSDTGMDAQTGRVLREHLPGETGAHRIAQLAGYPQDDVQPQRVPPGSIYLLGDDRDMAADSRIPLADEGIGPAPISAIIGRPLYILWSRDHSRIGQRADH